MPREDIHNVDDLVRVINEEVSFNVVHTGPRRGNLRQDPRATAPYEVSRMAIQAQLRDHETTDATLLATSRYAPRILDAVSRLQQTARFRR